MKRAFGYFLKIILYPLWWLYKIAATSLYVAGAVLMAATIVADAILDQREDSEMD